MKVSYFHIFENLLFGYLSNSCFPITHSHTKIWETRVFSLQLLERLFDQKFSNFHICYKVHSAILLFVFSSMQRNAAEHIMRWDEGGNKGNADREPPYLYLPQGPWAMTL